MLLAEDLLLLLISKSCGELPRHRGTQTALAAAVLIEVAAAGRLTVDGSEPPGVAVADGAPLGDPLLATAIRPGPVPDVLKAIVPGLYGLLLDRLTEQGLLTRTNRWWSLGLTSRTVWRLADHNRRDDLRRRRLARRRGHPGGRRDEPGDRSPVDGRQRRRARCVRLEPVPWIFVRKLAPDQQLPQGNVTALSHNPPVLRTIRWNATNTFDPREAG